MGDVPSSVQADASSAGPDTGKGPKLAVWKFASCDGCQLSLLDCEDELLMVADQVQIAYFPEATRRVLPPPYDISLVEGSITTPDDLQRIQNIRRDSKVLMTIGACATAGGIQSLRNFADVGDYVRWVYARPDYIVTLDTATPIAAHVPVDFELRGCPINKYQLLEVLNAFLNHRVPNVSGDSVCVECKAEGHACVMVTEKKPCMGPITHAGCQALCPGYRRACFGCYGPKSTLNAPALTKAFADQGTSETEIVRLLRTYNAGAEPFLSASEAYVNASKSDESSTPETPPSE